MEIEKFVEKLKQSKYGTKGTVSFDLKVFVNKGRTEQTIRCIEKRCHHCNSEKSTEIKVKFFKSHNLTLFEGGLLYYLFCLDKRPFDYADFHKCIAGKRFIENIKSVEVQN